MGTQSSIPIDFTHATVTLVDNNGLTRSLRFFDGNLTATNVGYMLNEVLNWETQGVYNASGYGNRIYPTLSFQGHCSEFSDSSTGTFVDMARQQGAFHPTTGSIASPGTKDDVGPVRRLDVKVVIDKRRGDEAPFNFTLTDCAIDIEVSNGSPAMWSFTCNSVGQYTGELANFVLGDV